jgi:hypothetical protein
VLEHLLRIHVDVRAVRSMTVSPGRQIVGIDPLTCSSVDIDTDWFLAFISW